MAAIAGTLARQMAKTNAGVVISAGKMQKTVTVRMAKEQWNRKLRKNYTVYYKLLVNDPTDAIIAGDIVTLTPERHSKHVKYTVSDILAPFGKPIAERPALLTAEERLKIYEDKRARKAERKNGRILLVQQGALGDGESVSDGSVEVVGTGPETPMKDAKPVAGAGKGKIMQDGREVLPGGLHRFGKINEELLRVKGKEKELVDKTRRNEEEREKAKGESR